jgi:glutathione S-transferase
MITVHHLETSRSQRILWLLEELALDYEIERYQRNEKTRLAPPELKGIHPLGKSPVISDGDVRVHESGAITDYLIRAHGNGRLAPAIGSADYLKYVEWLHYAEGSAMLPLMLHLYTSRLGDAGAPLRPRIDSETANHFSFMNGEMTGRDYFVGDDLSGADIMMPFPVEIAQARGLLEPYEALSTWADRMHARPAYVRAFEKAGDYALGVFGR